MDCTFGCCTTTSSSQRRAERAEKTHFDFTPNLDRSFKATSPNQQKERNQNTEYVVSKNSSLLEGFFKYKTKYQSMNQHLERGLIISTINRQCFTIKWAPFILSIDSHMLTLKIAAWLLHAPLSFKMI